MLLRTSRRVLALDPVRSRVEMAAFYGADGIAASDDPVAESRRVSADGPEVVIEASGTQQGLELALALVRPLGRVSLVGVPPPLTGMNLFWPVHNKGIRLVPLHRESAASPQGGGEGSPRRAHLPDVLEMISRRQLDIKGLTSWVVPPDRAPEAMGLIHRRPDLTLGLGIAWDDGEVTGMPAFERALESARSD